MTLHDHARVLNTEELARIGRKGRQAAYMEPWITDDPEVRKKLRDGKRRIKINGKWYKFTNKGKGLLFYRVEGALVPCGYLPKERWQA